MHAYTSSSQDAMSASFMHLSFYPPTLMHTEDRRDSWVLEGWPHLSCVDFFAGSGAGFQQGRKTAASRMAGISCD